MRDIPHDDDLLPPQAPFQLDVLHRFQHMFSDRAAAEPHGEVSQNALHATGIKLWQEHEKIDRIFPSPEEDGGAEGLTEVLREVDTYIHESGDMFFLRHINVHLMISSMFLMRLMLLVSSLIMMPESEPSEDREEGGVGIPVEHQHSGWDWRRCGQLKTKIQLHTERRWCWGPWIRSPAWRWWWCEIWN